MKPLQVPHWGLYGESCPFPEPFFMSLGFPIKSSPDKNLTLPSKSLGKELSLQDVQ